MGKHKKKSKDHKRSKHKSKRDRKRSSSSSSTGDEWVEKQSHSSGGEETTKDVEKSTSAAQKNEPREASGTRSTGKRDEWMSIMTSFSSVSSADKRKSRDEEKRLERERQQYNPSTCARELNPYWKDGGDGLPTNFKKPSEFTTDHHSTEQNIITSQASSSRKIITSHKTSNWKRKDHQRSDEVCKEKTKPIDESGRDGSSDPQSERLSDKEMNLLASRIMKAELMGNLRLAGELKEKLEAARKDHATRPVEVSEEIILTQTDHQGQVKPLKMQSASDNDESAGSKRKKQKLETHTDGQRVRYFADDDKYSLKEMFEREKCNNSAAQQNSEFVKVMGKVRKNDDLDDVFADDIRHKKSDEKQDERNKSRAIEEHRRQARSLDRCKKCLQSDSMQKNLIIATRNTAYLSLPSYEPLTEGHCFIAPVRHVPCATQLDENEWQDLMDLRRALTNMFRHQNCTVVFFEISMAAYKFPHMHVECVPLPKEMGDLAPIYFKKAIDESESEWAQNKKLVVMKGKDVRRVIPKGLSYFWVSFGLEEGFAHVIEDEKRFPVNFAQEIIGGMLDLHHHKWRKPREEKFADQSKRVQEFSRKWKEFDCTNM